MGVRVLVRTLLLLASGSGVCVSGSSSSGSRGRGGRRQQQQAFVSTIGGDVVLPFLRRSITPDDNPLGSRASRCTRTRTPQPRCAAAPVTPPVATDAATGPIIERDGGSSDGRTRANGGNDASVATSGSDTPGTKDDGDAFSLLAGLAASCLLESELKRDAVVVGGRDAGRDIPSGATNWVDDASALSLRGGLDGVEVKLADQRFGPDRDEAGMWIRWMKAAPAPLVVELSKDFRAAANSTITERHLEMLDADRDDILGRLGCRLICLPSGLGLRRPLRTPPPGGVAFGKLLYGGVRRFRILPGGGGGKKGRAKRRTAERTVTRESTVDNPPSWVQYGGGERQYEAVDMGAAALLEIVILPRGHRESLHPTISSDGDDMVLSALPWKPRSIFSMGGGDVDDGDDPSRTATTVNSNGGRRSDAAAANTAMTLSGIERNDAFEESFKSRVGGLQPQIESIVRRVLDGRVIRPAGEGLPLRGLDTTTATTPGGEDDDGDRTNSDLARSVMDAEELALLGLTPVRGLLLHGPPGCGKTALAREISLGLGARAPKIVAAPELLDRWVGGSERLVRDLFADAEAELAACGGDAGRSALHVVVVDEIDAVFRRRSVSAEDSGEATRSSAVNQILAKLDGVNAIPNVLLVGMTNRRELLDEALLRPGRLEVQIEIPLPDRRGRREILEIHFDSLRQRGRLSQPLCHAIDGVGGIFEDGTAASEVINDAAGVSGRKRRAFRNMVRKTFVSFPARRPVFDLAADSVTGGFSGADIAGLVRCAGSIALARARRDRGGVTDLLITLDDVKEALEEIRK